MKYLGFLKAEGTVRSGVPGVAVAEGRLGIVLRRSLLRGLPKMLERCEEQPEMAGLEEDVWLGRCLWQHDVHFASFLDPEEVFLEDLELAGSYSKAWKRLAVETEYLYSKLSVLQCLLVLSGLTPEDLVDLHRHVGKSQRWHPGIACTLRGLTWPDARHPLDATRPSLEPEVRQALQACFLSRAYTRWRDGKYGGGQLELTSPEDLAKEWASPSALTTGLAADVLRRAGHKVCVFVLTTSATAKHRADARAVVKTWAAQPRPPGVEVFMVKDNSWSTEELVGADGSDGPPILSLHGDVDLGFLYNPIRAFLLWRYLAVHHPIDCDWYAKVDSDTFLNLWALLQRLDTYFNGTQLHYLGSLKPAQPSVEESFPFAVNSIVISGALLRKARTWLSLCFHDVIARRLGQGAEDVDFAACLRLHGWVAPAKLGEMQELPSRSYASIVGGGDGGKLLGMSGACTLLIHPVHAHEMLEVHAELLRQEPEKTSCTWPSEDQQLDGKAWADYKSIYLAKTWQQQRENHRCWDRFFNWRLCCHPRWGLGGNAECWDDENTWHRCCNRTNPYEDASLEDLPTTTTSTTTLSLASATAASASMTDMIFHVTNDHRAPLRALTRRDEDVKGNPKCWSEGFSYKLCCAGGAARNDECWVWPFSREFCCHAPLEARPPIRCGGLPGSGARTSRCQGVEDQSLLACQLSLDELGVLFELPAIGSGDKASGWHDYLGLYERLILHLPLTADVLEFGVRMGSSLAMWSEYFPLGHVVGIDKNLGTFFQRGRPVLTDHGAFTRGNVYVLEANASDASGRRKLQRLGWEHFDLIVDDANHWHKDQIARFELFFPEVLRPGGAYIIEDVHMQPPWDHDGRTVRAYFAQLTASVYVTEEILLGSHQIRSKRQASEDWRHKVESVTFMRDMVAIVKAADAA